MLPPRQPRISQNQMLTSNFDEVFRIESFAGLLTCLCEQTFILGVYGAFLTRRTL